MKTAVDAFHRKLPYRDGLWVEEIQENMRKGIGGWSGKSLLPLDRPMYTEKTGLHSLNLYIFPTTLPFLYTT